MGLSASKRVKGSLSNSPEFNSACDSAYSHCLSLTQQAFEGVFPYQLATASDHLHYIFSTQQPHPLILKWVPSPPTRSQVDSALQVVTRCTKNDSPSGTDREQILGPIQFKSWAVELFTDAVVSNAGKAVLCRIPVGVAGIAGIGAVTRSGEELVGTAIGAYSLGVAISIFISLLG
ncbi:Transmembrane protein [Quillaja saponaria]|uniref:Transmembrane protein n=1 Tax=Quillaja saponaria TaxID=32244 RepID=A0AAD7KYI1_QUISA|nr:Transmembrane protein [Quillaja saponaria]